MDQVLKFSYNGKEYTGYLVSSLTIIPHYHWFLFHDAELIQTVADEIAFVERDGKLIPVSPLLAEKHPELYNTIQELIRTQLDNSTA